MGTPLSRLRIGATATLVAAAAAGIVAAVHWPGGRAFFLGLSLVALLEIPSYWALSLTLRLSNGKFYGALAGGMMGRLLALGAGLWIVWGSARESLVPFVLAAVVGLIGFSFIELFFIGRQNRLSI